MSSWQWPNGPEYYEYESESEYEYEYEFREHAQHLARGSVTATNTTATRLSYQLLFFFLFLS